MTSFNVLRILQQCSPTNEKLTPQKLNLGDLAPGSVVIKNRFSSLNFKDALAITGKGKILKKFPLIAGIDLAGEVIESEDPRFRPQDKVIVTGCGIGEDHDGGYSEVSRLSGDWIVPLPEGLSLEEAMIYGTAGFTAGLSLSRMEANGQQPSDGPIVVTGASGGVGMLATAILSKAGYEVFAISGKKSCHEILMNLGAKQVLSVEELNLGSRPLEKSRFAGAIDNLGGKTLAGLLSHTKLWGNVASVGLASSHVLDSTVMPFILRGVSLLGISSTNAPMSIRRSIWQQLAKDWKPSLLHEVHSKTISLSQLPNEAERMLDRKTFGRTVVDLTL